MKHELSDKMYDRVKNTVTLPVRLQITGNATPASKVHREDMAPIAILRTEGKVATADAIEDLSADFTTADDNATGDSVFGVLLRKELNDGQFDGIGEVERVLDVAIYDLSGTATSVAATLLSGSSSVRGLTADGNIAIEIAGTGLNLASENADLLMIVRYLAK